MTTVDESAYHLPARDLPVPTSVSPEAQAYLASARPPARSRWDAVTDLAGWRQAIAAQQKVVDRIMPALDPSTLAATVEDRKVEEAVVYVATPDPATGDDRVVLEMHGGALILGGGAECRNTAQARAARSGMSVWSVDYRMPPDHPYPSGLDDCVAAYRALLGERSPDRIVISGGSAGANLAGATILRARDEGLPLPAAAILGSPEIDLTESGDSFQVLAGIDSILTSLMPVNLLYADGHDLADPYLSPLFGDFDKGFPPTILTCGTRDLFLSNTVRMHRSLRRAGVQSELHVQEAAPHGNFLGRAPEDAEIAAEVDRFIDRYCPRS